MEFNLKTKIPKPSEAELEILQVLWRDGPSTVREIFDKISINKPVGYTTVLKIMQRMTEKNILKRKEQNHKHVYQPTLREEDTQKVLLDKILNSAFGGSALKLVMQALGNKKSSKEDLKKIREYLDSIYKEK